MMPNNHIFTFLLLGVLCFAPGIKSFALQNGNNNWELAKEADGVEVYVRTIENSAVTEFKATITIKGTMVKMVKAIHHLSDYPEWMSSCTEASVLTQGASSPNKIYLKYDLPWPIHDIDMVCDFNVIHQSDNYYHAEIVSISSDLPVEYGVQRVISAGGSWKIENTGANTFQVTYQFYYEPAEELPRYFINTLTIEGPYITLTNFKEIFLSRML